jgi:2-polyprenyl-3-methyl-5-hydroxy-6-metoxy-1,4-benzoquinol methylase
MNQVSSENTDFSEETRAVYHKQHIRVAKNDKIMKRFINMFSTEYFGISKDYFKGKKVLDAGCGNTAKVIIAL